MPGGWTDPCPVTLWVKAPPTQVFLKLRSSTGLASPPWFVPAHQSCPSCTSCTWDSVPQPAAQHMGTIQLVLELTALTLDPNEFLEL